jgi:hypothetical protein
MVNHKLSIVYQIAGLSYKKGFSIKVNGVSEKNSSPRHLDCSYILYIVSTNAIELWLCAGAYIHSSAQWKPRGSTEQFCSEGSGMVHTNW